MKLVLEGGSWISASGYGTLGNDKKPRWRPGIPVIPDTKQLFQHTPQRFGRFDQFTKIGWALIALALKNAGIQCDEISNTGIILETYYGCQETDLDFLETIKFDNGMYGSPNLFSYTLPNIVLGECAISFKLTGPTFCVSNENNTGMTALNAASWILRSGVTGRLVVARLETFTQEKNSKRTESIAIVLSSLTGQATPPLKILDHENSKWYSGSSEIKCLEDLF